MPNPNKDNNIVQMEITYFMVARLSVNRPTAARENYYITM